MCVYVCVWGRGGWERVRKKCVSVREFEGRVSPSLLWRLLNGSCAPGLLSIPVLIHQNPCVVLLS